MESNNDTEIQNFIFKVNTLYRGHSTERHHRKVFIRNVMDKLLQYAVGDDPKYTQQMGIVSRSYRGLGTYGSETGAQFDVQLPLAPPKQVTVGRKEHVDLSVRQKLV